MKDDKLHITLSVVIVNFNVHYFLEQCLLSVKKALTGINSEIIVVDNNSKDDSCFMLKSNFKEVILIENKDNIGFSKANTQGVAIAKGEWLLILNPDTVLAEDTLQQVLKFAVNQEKIGAVGVQFMDGSARFLPECKRGVPTPKIAFGKLFGFPKSAINRYYASSVKPDEISEIPILTGAFMLMKKEIYQEVNGFDRDYFMYGEDIDLSYKILKKGYSNYYFGKTKIIHYKGESTIKNKKYLQRFYGAMEIFYKKHFKVNRLMNLLMYVAIKSLYIVKTFSLKDQTNNNFKKAIRFIYIGKDDATFARLKSKIQPELAIFHQDISIQDILANQPNRIIFDMNFLSYKQVFSTMKKLENKNISFRFIPPNTNFIIGSDHNNTKGEVLCLD